MELTLKGVIFINVSINDVFDTYGVGCRIFGNQEGAALVRKRSGIGTIFFQGGSEQFSPNGVPAGCGVQGVRFPRILAETEGMIVA